MHRLRTPLLRASPAVTRATFDNAGRHINPCGLHFGACNGSEKPTLEPAFSAQTTFRKRQRSQFLQRPYIHTPVQPVPLGTTVAVTCSEKPRQFATVKKGDENNSKFARANCAVRRCFTSYTRKPTNSDLNSNNNDEEYLPDQDEIIHFDKRRKRGSAKEKSYVSSSREHTSNINSNASFVPIYQSRIGRTSNAVSPRNRNAWEFVRNPVLLDHSKVPKSGSFQFAYTISSSQPSPALKIDKLKRIKILDVATRGVTLRPLKGQTNRLLVNSPIKRFSTSFTLYISAPTLSGNPLHLVRNLVNEQHFRIRPVLSPKPPHPEYPWSILRRARAISRGLRYTTDLSVGTNILYTVVPAKSLISRRAIDRNRVRRRVTVALKKVLPRILSPLLFADIMVVPKPTALLTPMPILCAEIAEVFSDILANEPYALGVLAKDAGQQLATQLNGRDGESYLTSPNQDHSTVADQMWLDRKGANYRAAVVLPCKPALTFESGELSPLIDPATLPHSSTRQARSRPAFYVHPLYTNSALAPGRIFDAPAATPILDSDVPTDFLAELSSAANVEDKSAILRALLSEMVYSPLPESIREQIKRLKTERETESKECHDDKYPIKSRSKLWRKVTRRAMRKRFARRHGFLSTLYHKRVAKLSVPDRSSGWELVQSTVKAEKNKDNLGNLISPLSSNWASSSRLQEMIRCYWARPNRSLPRSLRVPHCPFMALPPWRVDEKESDEKPLQSKNASAITSSALKTVPVPWTLPNVEHTFRHSLVESNLLKLRETPLSLYPGSFHHWTQIERANLFAQRKVDWSLLSLTHPVSLLSEKSTNTGNNCRVIPEKYFASLALDKDMYRHSIKKMEDLVKSRKLSSQSVDANIMPLPACIPPIGAVPVVYVRSTPNPTSNIPLDTNLNRLTEAVAGTPITYRSPPALAQDLGNMSTEEAKRVFETHIDRHLSLPSTLNIPYAPIVSGSADAASEASISRESPNSSSSTDATISAKMTVSSQDYALVLFLCALYDAERDAVRKSAQKSKPNRSSLGGLNDTFVPFVRNSESGQQVGPETAYFTTLFKIHAALELIYTSMHCDEHISSIVSASLAHRSDRAPAFTSLMRIVGAGGIHGGVTGQGGLRRVVIHRRTGSLLSVRPFVYREVRVRDRGRTTTTSDSPNRLVDISPKDLVKPFALGAHQKVLKRLVSAPSLKPMNSESDCSLNDFSALGTKVMTHAVHVPRSLRLMLKLLIDLNQLHLLHEIIPKFRELCVNPYRH